MKCDKCGHRESLHYCDQGNDKRYCLGECYECPCVTQYFENDIKQSSIQQ